ncbi:MAG: hypothetical protein L6Q37_16495 [Bdellovibrionaceae bacterium]|nr:hypothetical protein [Pseudobdellovibrionaceae bacterium]NUM57190.1 hypothetical protein [Pseudobdellovibrionaceae bacterium]
MNIKSVIPNNLISPIKTLDKVDRMIKSDSTHDRDANGQQAYDQNQKQHEPMTEEQLKEAMEHLKNLPFVKEHKWQIQLVVEDAKRYVLVKDNLGEVIRRFPEIDLWTLPVDLEDRRGQLLKKSA